MKNKRNNGPLSLGLSLGIFHRKYIDEFFKLSCFLYHSYYSGLTGLELAASALTGWCSGRLNYNPSKHTYTYSYVLQ